jgi:hypothetical protein
MVKKSSVPESVGEVLREIGLTPDDAGWDCHGTYVLLHKALEKVAAKRGVVFDPPQILAANATAKEAVVLCVGHMGEKSEWSIGEAAAYNNKNSYPFAMAEKRAKDRVILKLVGLHGDVYSEDEADAFKESRPEGKTATPSPKKPAPAKEPKAKEPDDLKLVSDGIKDLMKMETTYDGLRSFWSNNNENIERMKAEEPDLYNDLVEAFKAYSKTLENPEEG